MTNGRKRTKILQSRSGMCLEEVLQPVVLFLRYTRLGNRRVGWTKLWVRISTDVDFAKSHSVNIMISRHIG